MHYLDGIFVPIFWNNYSRCAVPSTNWKIIPLVTIFWYYCDNFLSLVTDFLSLVTIFWNNYKFLEKLFHLDGINYIPGHDACLLIQIQYMSLVTIFWYYSDDFLVLL